MKCESCGKYCSVNDAMGPCRDMCLACDERREKAEARVAELESKFVDIFCALSTGQVERAWKIADYEAHGGQPVSVPSASKTHETSAEAPGHTPVKEADVRGSAANAVPPSPPAEAQESRGATSPCDCPLRERCVRDLCSKCCYCGAPMPERSRSSEAKTATERHGWAVLHGKTVVECPGCCFTMGIEHENQGEDRPYYDCPNCGDSSAVHPPRSNEAPLDTEDDDPANMRFRSGFLDGLAASNRSHLNDHDRDMLRRAARSLEHAAKRCSDNPTPSEVSEELAAWRATFEQQTREGGSTLSYRDCYAMGTRRQFLSDQTSEGRRAPVVTNDEVTSRERVPSRDSKNGRDPMTPSSQPGASEEAGVISDAWKVLLSRISCDVPNAYKSTGFHEAVNDMVFAVDRVQRNVFSARRPDLYEVAEYVERRWRAATDDSNQPAADAYALVLDFVRNAKFDVPRSETAGTDKEGTEQ